MILTENRNKSRNFCKWKAESWVQLLQAHYGIKFDLEITDYALMDDFMGCMHVNHKLTAIVGDTPQVCVIGDGDGVVGIMCFLQLVAAHVCLVHRASATVQDRIAVNLARFFRVANNFCSEQQIKGYKDALVQKEPTSYEEYQKYIDKDRQKVIFDSPGASLHNQYPWQFLRNCPENKHFDVIFWQNVWNRKYLEQMHEIEKKFGDTGTDLDNFSRGLDPHLVNDLELHEAEATHKETLYYLHEFIVKGMKKNKVTCTVIVFKIRGKLEPAVWNASPLAKDFVLRFQIEEFPNERSERLAFDPETNKVISLPDYENHTKFERVADGNGGILGQYFSVCIQFKEDVKGRIPTWEYTPYSNLRPDWYGPLLFCSDAKKQGMYVKRKSQLVPFRRISTEAHHLTAILENDCHSKLDLSEYMHLPALRRKIEVQIKDLEFYSKTFHGYLNREITMDENELKGHIERFEYNYKIIDNSTVSTQVLKKDSEARRTYGVNLVKTKKLLFRSVHVLAWWIEAINNWILPKVTNKSSRVKPLDKKKLKILRNFSGHENWGPKSHVGSVFPCGFEISKNGTLGEEESHDEHDFYSGDSQDEIDWDDEWNDIENDDELRDWINGRNDRDDYDDRRWFSEDSGFSFDSQDDAQRGWSDNDSEPGDYGGGNNGGGFGPEPGDQESPRGAAPKEWNGVPGKSGLWAPKKKK